MLRLIYRQLIYVPFRTTLTCLALASALALLLLLEGFQSGLLSQLKNVALNRGADLIVTQAGVSNFVASRSLLPQLSRERVEAIDGVTEAHPITMVPVIYEQEGYRKSPIFFIVYDTGGGHSVISSGSAVSKPRDLVIATSIAVRSDLKPGDPFVVADYRFQIAGITEDTSAFFTAFSFIIYDDMIDFFFDSDLVGDISNLPLLSYLLVELESDAEVSSVAAAIERVEPNGDVFTPEQIALNDVALGRTLFGPVLGVLIGAGYVIALLVVSMIMFGAVHARLRNYGVMKALGFPDRMLLKEMILESIIMILLAFPLALLLAQTGSWFIETKVPLYRVPVTEFIPLLRTLIASLLLGVAGACLPYHIVSRQDPAVVFRS